MSNIYDFCNVFYLVINGVDNEIEEPIGWDQVNIKIKRDDRTHGIIYEFSDGEVDLTFDCPAGAELLRAEYDSLGNDALVQLKFGYIDNNNIFQQQYEGVLNFNSYRLDDVGHVSCSVKNTPFEELLRTRFDTLVDLETDQTLDGDPLVPLDPIDTWLYSKKLVKNYEIEQINIGETPFSVQHTFDINTTFVCGDGGSDDYAFGRSFSFSLDSVVIDELKQGIQDQSGFFDNIPEGQIFLVQESGAYDIELDLNFQPFVDAQLAPGSGVLSCFPILDCNGNGSGDTNAWWNEIIIDTHFRVEDENNVVVFDNIINTTNYSDPGQANTTCPPNADPYFFNPITFNYSLLNVPFEENWSLYVYYRFTLQARFVKQFFDQGFDPIKIDYLLGNNILPGTKFKLKALTQTPSSYAGMHWIHETIDRNLEIITGKTMPLYSEFYGRPELGYPDFGCGSKRRTSNGFKIRRFGQDGGTDRPVQTSMGITFDSLNMMDNIGLNIELDQNNNERVRIEQKQFFYSDGLILSFADVADYKESHASEFVYNEVNIGYNKYPDDGEENTLDDIHTEQQYLAPIKTFKQKYEQISEFIASAYAIEYTRREQFAEKPTNNYKYDDDVFIFSMIERCYDYDIVTISPNNSFVVELVVDIPTLILEQIGTLEIIGGPNAGVYTILSVSDLTAPFYSFRVVEPIPDQLDFSGTLQICLWKPEADENFSVINNILDPESYYNFRLSIKRCLLNHGWIINSGYRYKPPTDEVKFTFGKGNYFAETQLINGAECPNGDPDYLLWQEGGDVQLSQYNQNKKLFSPEWVEFKTRLSFDDIIYIKNAHKNLSPDNNNYGYFEVTDYNGVVQQFYLWELNYMPGKEMAEFKGIKRFNNA